MSLTLGINISPRLLLDPSIFQYSVSVKLLVCFSCGRSPLGWTKLYKCVLCFYLAWMILRFMFGIGIRAECLILSFRQDFLIQSVHFDACHLPFVIVCKRWQVFFIAHRFSITDKCFKWNSVCVSGSADNFDTSFCFQQWQTFDEAF